MIFDRTSMISKWIVSAFLAASCATHAQIISVQEDPNRGCRIDPAEWVGMHQQDLVLQLGAEQNITLPVGMADESDERRAGYQWVCPKQAENTAILFPFSGEIDTAFHMRNVYVPLNIIFFDAQGGLVDKLWMSPEANTEGQPQYYRPSGPFKFALEMTESFTASRLVNAEVLSLNLAASGLL
ncbi:MAG: uncharacterized membrane protein (UPF0127 family) [Saprospiraceae bacterium]|jgi:uncharacterized membrane protein (UPF0127 family)